MAADETELNAQTEADDVADAGTEGTEGAAPAQTKTVASPEGGKPAAKEAEGKEPAGGKTLADGADTEAADKAKEEADAKKAPKSDWPENWREKLAEHAAAGDKKRYNQELKRLQRITDPMGV